MPSLFATVARTALTVAVLASAPLASAASLSGAYLAAMQADFRNDYDAAARYYDRALSSDPTNPGLLQNAVVANTAAGDVERARELADQIAITTPDSQVASLVRVADMIAKGEYDEAAALLSGSGAGLNPLLGGLLRGWVEVGRENFDAAKAAFDAVDANPALRNYGQYHKALALALAGDFVSAADIMAGGGNGPLHLNRGALVAHAEILSQLDRRDEAIAIVDSALAGGIPDETLIDLRTRLAMGGDLPFGQVTDAKDGAAEVFLTLADGLNAPDTQRVALLHARLAEHIRPAGPEAHLLTAELLDAQAQFGLAVDALAGVPADSPWFVTAELRRADTQREAGDPDAGIATLTALAAAHPQQIEVQSALGDALRGAERYPEAVEAYTRALDLVTSPQQIHWVLYYTRGIANERARNWEAAEADFRQALALEPEQPLVLNYLGYSLVEQRRSLDEALGMIERAVEQQPDDGYITDSLGWVLYRLGRYDEAVPHMLRAVELTPDDPVINDHLGDVLWKVGRKREAEFQWHRALSFGPADELDMDRVRRKLEVGLDEVLAGEATQNGG